MHRVHDDACTAPHQQVSSCIKRSRSLLSRYLTNLNNQVEGNNDLQGKSLEEVPSSLDLHMSFSGAMRTHHYVISTPLHLTFESYACYVPFLASIYEAPE